MKTKIATSLAAMVILLGLSAQEAHAIRFGPILGAYREDVCTDCHQGREYGLKAGIYIDPSPDTTCNTCVQEFSPCCKAAVVAPERTYTAPALAPVVNYGNPIVIVLPERQFYHVHQTHDLPPPPMLPPLNNQAVRGLW